MYICVRMYEKGNKKIKFKFGTSTVKNKYIVCTYNVVSISFNKNFLKMNACTY